MDNKISRNRPATKNKVHFNSADLMVLILCVVCIIGVVLRFGVMETIENNATNEAAMITLLIEGVSQTSAEYISASDIVYLDDSDMKFGVVSSVVSVSPSAYYEYRDDGSIDQLQSVNGRVDIRIVVSVVGSMTDAGFLLDGTTYIAPNMRLDIHTSSLSVGALITDLQIAEK